MNHQIQKELHVRSLDRVNGNQYKVTLFRPTGRAWVGLVQLKFDYCDRKTYWEEVSQTLYETYEDQVTLYQWFLWQKFRELDNKITPIY